MPKFLGSRKRDFMHCTVHHDNSWVGKRSGRTTRGRYNGYVAERLLHLVVAQASKRQWRFKSFHTHVLTRDSEVECLTVNQVVVGSIPTESAIGLCLTPWNGSMFQRLRCLTVYQAIRVRFPLEPPKLWAESRGLSLPMITPLEKYLFVVLMYSSRYFGRVDFVFHNARLLVFWFPDFQKMASIKMDNEAPISITLKNI